MFASTYIPYWAFWGVGVAIASAPSIQSAKKQALPVFSYIDEKSTLDTRISSKDKLLLKIDKGHIEFKSVNFNYPSQKQLILDSFDMEIPATGKIALVGHSGCGKSTVTNLLLRFYNIKSGQILIDGKEIDDYNVHHFRR